MCYVESTMVVQGKGIPRGSSGIRGALIVHFSICYPYVLTRNERDMIRFKFGKEGEDIIDYIVYQAEQRIRREFAETMSVEEFIYSSQSSENRTCLCTIPFE